MMKIGFIDYYIDEWHANNYPQWIREQAAATGQEIDVAYVWAETVREGGMDTAEWCERYKVELTDTLEELVERSDCLIVLSPDHSEHHERLGRLALMSGKPVYMDKTFSPDLASGQRMFELANAHGTPLFSSSALRYSKEIRELPADTVNRQTIEFAAVTGPGHYANYAVHQFEMIVTLMGTGAKRIKSISTANGRLLVVDYSEGRQATMLQLEGAPFQMMLQLDNGHGVSNSCSEFFTGLIEAILEFFRTGKPPVPQAETLEVMALIEAGRRAIAQQDEWMDI